MNYEMKKKTYKNILTSIAVVAILLTVFLFTLNYPVSEREEIEEMNVILVETSFARWTVGNSTYINHSVGFHNSTYMNIYYTDSSRLASSHLLMDSDDIILIVGGNLSVNIVHTTELNIYGQWMSKDRYYIVTVPEDVFEVM